MCFDLRKTAKSSNFGENEIYKVIFCKGLTTFKNQFDNADFIAGPCFLFVCLWAFLAHLQKRKNKNFGGAMVKNSLFF